MQIYRIGRVAPKTTFAGEIKISALSRVQTADGITGKPLQAAAIAAICMMLTSLNLDARVPVGSTPLLGIH